MILDLSPEAFVAQLRSAVARRRHRVRAGEEHLRELDCMAGCRIGSRGEAPRTSATPRHGRGQGIAGVIVLDALFAACANALGI